MSGARIWIIDDDRSIRWVLERALTQAGMSVTAFENGAEAMARLGGEQPDVVVSDIRMPEMDGLSLLESISSRHPELPVIIMTAYSINPWCASRCTTTAPGCPMSSASTCSFPW